MARTINGTYSSGFTLSSPSDNPFSITSTGIIISSGDAIRGNAGTNWTVKNDGTLNALVVGVELFSGGTVTNGTDNTKALIAGALGGVNFFGTGSSTLTNGGTIIAALNDGVYFGTSGGGSVTNGSTSNASALITGENQGVQFDIGRGTVTNFGTIAASSFGAVLFEDGGTVLNTGTIICADGDSVFSNSGGGSVTNGSATDTSAIIAGSTRGVQILHGAGTITNFATITGAVYEAILLKEGGTVTNGSTSDTKNAIIEGRFFGIQVYADSGNVTNFSTISGDRFTGVYLKGGGVVVNGSTSDTAASIEGNYFGVAANNASGKVTNFGTISGVKYAAVQLKDGGTVINGAADDTSALMAGAVQVTSSSGTVLNFGTIVARGVAFSAVYLNSGGTVTNGSSADTGASVTGAYGVVVFGAAGVVTNFGTLAGTGPKSSGVYLKLGGSVTNAASGLVTGSAWGVSLGGPGTVTNLGTISGLTQDGVDLNAGGTLTNGARGKTAQIVAGKRGVYLGGATDSMTNFGTVFGKIGVLGGTAMSSATLTNAGTIIGFGGTAASFTTGSDRVVVEPGAVFSGNVIASASGANVLELGSAASVGTIGGIGTGFTNFKTLSVDAGARWTLQGGNALAKGAAIALGGAGTATVTGSLLAAGPLSLSGAGALAVAAGGSIAVGMFAGAAGTITVDSLAQGGTLSGSGILGGPVSDAGLVEASGGTLTLAGAVAGAGTIAISAHAALLAEGSVATAMTFLPGGSETLTLAAPLHATGTISGFVATDTIDLLGPVATGISFSSSTHILTVTGSGGTIAALHFAGSYTTASFTRGPDGLVGTKITHV